METTQAWTVLHRYPDDPQLDRRWRAFLTNADFASHYVSPEYFREPFIRDKRPFVVLAWQNNQVVAALSGIHEEHQMACGLRSRPQICFDNNADLPAAAEALMQGLSQEANGDKLITFYSWVPLDSLAKYGYRCKQVEGVVMLDLTKGADELFKQFAPTRRTDVRNAIKRGLEVVVGSTEEDIKAYYEIYIDWIRRKQIEPVSFENVAEALRLPNRRVFLVRYEGKYIAASIVRLYPGGMVEYSANSSLAAYLKLRPNDFLQWRIVEWACREGYQRYSLGGAHLFVRRMGGSIAPIYRYRLDRTFLHRHELKEALGESGRSVFNALPTGLKSQVRRALKGHE